MTQDFLPQFRRRLSQWLQLRLAEGRMPFRRVEETPELLSGGALARPDLVLWINRDSLLAGAVILIPPKIDASILEKASSSAAALGLGQFVTWEARSVAIWSTTSAGPIILKSWELPGADTVSARDFSVVFELLLQELKNLAVAASLPPDRLPPDYFANLCRQTLRDLAPSLTETARISGGSTKGDQARISSARDKGWLTLWRLLALLWHECLPPGIDPARFERALGYALNNLPGDTIRLLVAADDDLPLTETAAVRFLHLGGRLKQLGWPQESARAVATLQLLLGEVSRDCQVASSALDSQPEPGTLLVNHLPPGLPHGVVLLLPPPCLVGLALTHHVAGSSPPSVVVGTASSLTGISSPVCIIATLNDLEPLPAAERRQRLAALRHGWPYRRFTLPTATPAWLWDALHLAGLCHHEGHLRLTIPGDWAAAPGAIEFWRTLAERFTLTALQMTEAGGQTLTLCSHATATEELHLLLADGSRQIHPIPEPDTGLETVAAMVRLHTPPSQPSPRPRAAPGIDADRIAATVFRDGLPVFPEHYLRRIERPAVKSYQLPGRLQPTAHFFNRHSLSGPLGEIIDCDGPVDAEALLLASHGKRRQIELPTDPELTLRLIDAYRNDLHRLWGELLAECRRQRRTQRSALHLAQRLWKERNLPPINSC